MACHIAQREERMDGLGRGCANLDELGSLDSWTDTDGERGHVGHFHRDEPRAVLFVFLTLDDHLSDRGRRREGWWEGEMRKWI